MSLYREETDELEADLVKLLHKHFVPDDALAKAIASVVSTAWEFGCDYDEVRDEALENLTEFKWSGESGSDQLITADVEFPCGGAILADAVLCSEIPAKSLLMARWNSRTTLNGVISAAIDSCSFWHPNSRRRSRKLPDPRSILRH